MSINVLQRIVIIRTNTMIKEKDNSMQLVVQQITDEKGLKFNTYLV